jgi:hypothetical protein
LCYNLQFSDSIAGGTGKKQTVFREKLEELMKSTLKIFVTLGGKGGEKFWFTNNLEPGGNPPQADALYR